MNKNPSFMVLMEDVIKDNDTVPFPVDDVRIELIHLMVSQEEFQYFLEEAAKKLQRKYGRIIMAVFLEVAQREMRLNDDFNEIHFLEYMDRAARFIQCLEDIRITTIPKDAPDYEMVLEMSKK